MKLRVIITPQAEGTLHAGEYGALIPSFNGLQVYGKTVEEALEKLKIAFLEFDDDEIMFDYSSLAQDEIIKYIFL